MIDSRIEWREPQRQAGILFAVLLSILSASVQAGARHASPQPGRFIENNIGLTVRPLTLQQLCARLHGSVKNSRDTPSLQVPGQVDRIATVTAKGLEVEAYVVAGSPIVIDRIVVSAGGPALPMPLRIGISTPDNVRAALGANAEAASGPDDAAALRYSNIEHTASALLWFDIHSHLAGVEWKFDAD